MVEYRLAKARVAGSNPVSCFLKRSESAAFLFPAGIDVFPLLSGTGAPDQHFLLAAFHCIIQIMEPITHIVLPLFSF